MKPVENNNDDNLVEIKKAFMEVKDMFLIPNMDD